MSAEFLNDNPERQMGSILDGRRLMGHLKSYNETNGYGFITCSETRELFQADVYIARRNIESCGARVGATVSFNVVLTTDGKPQARNVDLEEQGPERDHTARPRMHSQATEGDLAAMNGMRLYGVVKSFGQSTGFGFIDCAEVRNAYGGDVFLHKAEIGEFKVGDNVSFTLSFEPERGRPRAKDLAIATNTAAYQGAGMYGGMGGWPWAANPMGMAAMGQYGMAPYGMGAFGMNPLAMSMYGMNPYGMAAMGGNGGARAAIGDASGSRSSSSSSERSKASEKAPRARSRSARGRTGRSGRVRKSKQPRSRMRPEDLLEL